MDGLSEALGLFENDRSRLQMKFKAGSNPIENMRFSAFFVRGGRVIQEGIAVDTLLAGAGWNPAMLIQTEFGNT